MKGNRRPQPPAGATSLPPESPTAKGTAKYTNKDGSKFITVTKPQPPGPPEPSPRTATTLSSKAQAGSVDTSAVSGPPRSINPKKAKRRAKAAAKARAEPGPAGSFNSVAGSAAAADQDRHQLESVRSDGDVASSSDDGEQAAQHHPADSGFTDPSKSKKSKKKKKKGNLGPAGDSVSGRNDGPSANLPLQRGSGPTREKIWNTTSQEERERIKAFWLGLGEDERKSLVKVEKDTVLKKMKEQQKHTCSCNVCGRKRNAIEEELEGLYDAYYEELEQYAHDPNHQGQAPPMMRPRRHLGSVGGMHSRATPSNYSGQQPSRGRIVDQVGEDDEDDGDEDYSDEDLEDEDDDYSEGDEEDIPPDEIHRDYAADFFNFGNSLTVQGGILTVADDLLKNDGRKFIEMMEQLAERRMAREEDTKEQYTRGVGYGHDANGVDYSHSHPPSEEEEYGPEDEDDEEFESQEEEYEEDDMTEEQRMEEGRRMFQIFAARMFEQRVLTAYREKVANQRQEKLLEELADEESQEFQRKAKKAKEAQKRKEKAAQKKQAQAEERARKEAEKAADEAQRQAEEARKAEEQRHKADEKRKKKEAQKKAEDEDRLRKEADRLRRIHEQKERQAEQERKTREAKEREKKDREEARLKEKEARERKEREARERREKQENDKREKEVRARANEAKEKHKQEARAAQKAALLANAAAAAPPAAAPITLSKRPAQHPSTIPALPQQPPTSFASPQVAVATPTLPMAPAPMRPRQPSGQEPVPVGSRAASQSGSGHSQNASPHPVTPIQASPGVIGPKGIAANQAATANAHLTSPLNATAKPATQQHSPFSGMPPMGLPFQMIPPVVPPPGFGPPAGHYAALGGGGYRAPGPPQAMSGPPGSNALGRPFSPMVPPPGFGQQPLEQLAGITPFGSLAKDVGAPASHSRQPSAGFDPAPAPPQTQPIARPAPIRRPGSVQHGQRQASETRKNESEDPHHLGSKALLDDSDPSVDGFSATRRPVAAARSAFAPGPASFSMDASAAFASQSPIWNNPPPPSVGHGLPFGHGPPPVGFHVGTGIPGPWGPPSNQAPFASHGNPTRLGLGRSGTVRHLLCLLCSDLSTAAGPGLDGFVPLEDLQAHVSRVTGEPVQDVELAALFETEGNSTNGGGTFEVRWEDSGKLSAVRWAQSTDPLFSRPRNPAEVGSPVVGSGDWGGPR